MDFKITYPKNKTIKEYLKFSYTGILDNVSYDAYPNAGIPVCFFKDSNIEFDAHSIKVSVSEKPGIHGIYANNFYRPIHVETTGAIEEFCVIFHPYGLAQFLDKLPPLDENNAFFPFDYFNDFIAQHPNLFLYSAVKKSDVLEEYLLTKLLVKKHTAYIVDAIKNMHAEGNIQRIYPISPKTFYRAFKNICGVPESVLVKTIQFRKSLEKIKTENPEKTMCQLAYDLGYYDQAHFNKLFKQLTAETPSNFFSQVDTFSKENIYFKIK